jgi:hypothetical protein
MAPINGGGGNRCDRFSLPVGASRRPGRRREAGRWRRRARSALVQEEEEGVQWAGPAGGWGRACGGLGRPGGRGPVGEGRKIDR